MSIKTEINISDNFVDQLLVPHMEMTFKEEPSEYTQIKQEIKIEYECNERSDDERCSTGEVAVEPQFYPWNNTLVKTAIKTEQFDSRDDMHIHTTDIKITSEPKSMIVEIPSNCNKLSNIGIEIQKHKGDIPHQCKECNKRFGCASHLIRHSRTHSGDKPYECDECNRKFALKSDLKRHIILHANNGLNKCEVCNKRIRKDNIEKHMRRHTELPYKCSVCERQFSQRCHLKTHSRIHTGEQPFQCEVCQKRFKQRGDLTIHLRKHTGEKPYQCSVCTKCFAQNSDLKRHLLIHTGQPTHQCLVCEKRFWQTYHLKTHSRLHTGERPYQCEVCQKGFKQNAHLKKHLRMHTENRL